MCNRRLQITIWFISIGLTALLSSCCNEEPVETNRFALSMMQTQLLPYQQGSEIEFEHSSGFAFAFRVTEINDQWVEQRDHCGHRCCGGSYVTTQYREVNLRSTYPEIDLNLGIQALGNDFSGPAAIQLTFHRHHQTELPYAGTEGYICSENFVVCFDSLALNDQMFYTVFKVDFSVQPDPGNQGLAPRSVYYNELGIVHLDMTNDDSFTITL